MQRTGHPTVARSVDGGDFSPRRLLYDGQILVYDGTVPFPESRTIGVDDERLIDHLEWRVPLVRIERRREDGVTTRVKLDAEALVGNHVRVTGAAAIVEPDGRADTQVFDVLVRPGRAGFVRIGLEAAGDEATGDIHFTNLAAPSAADGPARN